MENDLFPPRAMDLPAADLPAGRAFPVDRGPEEPVGRGCMDGEGCGPHSRGLSEYPLAMVYAPCQAFRGLYDPQNALSRGTLFSELDLPLGRRECGLTTACSCRGERRPT